MEEKDLNLIVKWGFWSYIKGCLLYGLLTILVTFVGAVVYIGLLICFGSKG